MSRWLALALLLLATPAAAVPVTVRPEVTVRAEITIHEPVTYTLPVAELLALPVTLDAYSGMASDPAAMEHAPEPASLVLLGTVLAGLGWRIRRNW